MGALPMLLHSMKLEPSCASMEPGEPSLNSMVSPSAREATVYTIYERVEKPSAVELLGVGFGKALNEH